VSAPYDYLKSQFSETFIIFVILRTGDTVPSWFISENKEGDVFNISREKPIGIAIRDIDATYSMIYYSTLNADGETYMMHVEKADISVKVSDHQTFDAGSNCGDVITANEHIIVLSCTTFPGGIISVFRESDFHQFISFEGYQFCLINILDPRVTLTLKTLPSGQLSIRMS